MGRANYKGDKRRKEVERQKKQEEKRLRRFNKKHEDPNQPAEGNPEGIASGGDAPEGGTPEGGAPAGDGSGAEGGGPA